MSPQRRRTVTAELRDGTRVLVRPIQPDDRSRLSEGVKRLSPRTRYLRFHTHLRDLTDAQLDYLTRVDGHDHVALIALDESDLEVPGVGVARFIRLPDEPTVAEAAITIADEYHGRGAGTLLLGLLAAAAREEGVETFRNYVLEENEAMLEVFDELGAERVLEASGLYRVDLRLPGPDEEVPDSPAGRAFLAAARGQLVLGHANPPVWTRWLHPGSDHPSPEEEDAHDTSDLTAELDDWLLHRERRDVPGEWPREPEGDD